MLKSNVDENKKLFFHYHIDNLKIDSVLDKLEKYTKNFNVVITFKNIELDDMVSFFVKNILDEIEEELSGEKNKLNITILKVEENKSDIGQKIPVLKFIEDNYFNYSNILFVDNFINLDSTKIFELINYNLQVLEYFDIQINYQKILLK